ncbi:MAG: hypothetical protein KF684_11385 [Phycisphaeraceae bacterium]|nr:hypothetical protein [Phycisphaeraceae bacterium]
MNPADLFSEREHGIPDATSSEISLIAWNALRELLNTKIDAAWLTSLGAERCPDPGKTAIIGCDRRAVLDRIAGRVPEAVCGTQFCEHPSTETILDLLEFVYQNVSKPNSSTFHDYLEHYHHNTFSEQEARTGFAHDVNGILQSHRVSWRLEETGFERRVPADSALLITRFETADADLTNLLNDSVDRFLRDPRDLQGALEKLWDALERVKTVPAGNNKKKSAQNLIHAAAGGNVAVKNVLESEIKYLTTLGNEWCIRHHETDKHPIPCDDMRVYFYLRCMTFLRYLLPKADLLGVSGPGRS